jgi:hypothetical protein
MLCFSLVDAMIFDLPTVVAPEVCKRLRLLPAQAATYNERFHTLNARHFMLRNDFGAACHPASFDPASIYYRESFFR